MTNNYFKPDGIELNTRLTLLIDDVFNKIKKDFPNALTLHMFTTFDLKKESEDGIPAVLYIRHEDANNKILDMYIDFSKTTPELSNAGNLPPYLYTTNKNKRNTVDSKIHVDEYKKELLEAFPDLVKFKYTGYFRKDSDSKEYQPQLKIAQNLYMQATLQSELSNKPSLITRKNKI